MEELGSWGTLTIDEIRFRQGYIRGIRDFLSIDLEKEDD